MLKNLKVVELASVLAGPAVGMFFAELGAQVTKVENKLTGGDVTRKWKSASEDPNTPKSAYYSSVNWNKKIILADFSDAFEKNEILKLIKTADILILNFKKGDDLKFNLDYETVQKFNPGIIYASINGYGEEEEKTAFDLVLQAETGFMSMNGTQESGPLKMPVALIDLIAAHHLKEAILLAMINKINTGKGAKVSVSLFEAAVASLANQASNYLMHKTIPQRLGSLHPNIAPYGECFESSDNINFVLAVGNDSQFIQLCKILDITNLATDSRFHSNQNRVINRQELAPILALQFKKISIHFLEIEFNRRKIPFGIINDLKTLFEKNSIAQSMILKETDETGYQSERVKTIAFKTNMEEILTK